MKLEERPLSQVHLALLERFRASMNLVGPGEASFHFRDCAEALRVIDAPTGRWVDLGSGAGFPGLVFAAMFPRIPLDLVDSRRKRCVFLEQVVAEGRAPEDAPVTVRCARIEALPEHAWDGAMARALAPPVQVLAWADLLLRPDGRLVLLLNAGQEIDTAGWRIEARHDYTVDGKARCALVLQRA